VADSIDGHLPFLAACHCSWLCLKLFLFYLVIWLINSPPPSLSHISYCQSTCASVILSFWQSCCPCLWSWISQQPCEIRRQFILTTNRKPHIASQVVTWPMTSREPDRSRSWPQYLWSLIPQKLFAIDGRFKLTTYRKPHITSPVVTWHLKPTERAYQFAYWLILIKC